MCEIGEQYKRRSKKEKKISRRGRKRQEDVIEKRNLHLLLFFEAIYTPLVFRAVSCLFVQRKIKMMMVAVMMMRTAIAIIINEENKER